MKKGFTLLEITIVVTLLIIIAVSAFIFLNPFGQINKAYDAQRKHDLDTLKKALEDWYNDKGCYPKPEEICYDDTVITCMKNGSRYKVTSAICNICGKEANSPSTFNSYLDPLPCDPEHPNKKYLYEVPIPSELIPPQQVGSCQQNIDLSTFCPLSYRVYSDLSNSSDQTAINLGCAGGGCGIAPNQVPTPSPGRGYDYGIFSTNTILQFSNDFNCYTGSACQSCLIGETSNYQTCIQLGCSINNIYSSGYTCQKAHP